MKLVIAGNIDTIDKIYFNEQIRPKDDDETSLP